LKRAILRKKKPIKAKKEKRMIKTLAKLEFPPPYHLPPSPPATQLLS